MQDHAALWDNVRATTAAERASIANLLRQLHLASFDGQRAVLITDNPVSLAFARNLAVKPLADVFTRLVGNPVQLTIEAGAAPQTATPPHPSAPAAAPGRTPPAVGSAGPIAAATRAHSEPPPAAPASRLPPGPPVQDHPLVRRTIELLGARITRVQPRSVTAAASPPGPVPLPSTVQPDSAETTEDQ